MVTISVRNHGVDRGQPADLARRYAQIALVALAVEEIITGLQFILERRVPSLQAIPTIPAGTVVSTGCYSSPSSTSSRGLVEGRKARPVSPSSPSCRARSSERAWNDYQENVPPRLF